MKETVIQKLDKATKAARGRINPNLSPDDAPKASQAVLNMMHAHSVFTTLSTQEMDEELGVVLDRVRPNLQPTEMMKSTQAVLNMMHAKSQAEATKQAKKTKTN